MLINVLYMDFACVGGAGCCWFVWYYSCIKCKEKLIALLTNWAFDWTGLEA
jgi:hypothetical protein